MTAVEAEIEAPLADLILFVLKQHHRAGPLEDGTGRVEIIETVGVMLGEGITDTDEQWDEMHDGKIGTLCRRVEYLLEHADAYRDRATWHRHLRQNRDAVRAADHASEIVDECRAAVRAVTLEGID